MITIDPKMKITMVAGDTGSIYLKLDDYNLKQGDKVTFAVVAKEINYDQRAGFAAVDPLLVRKCILAFESDGSCYIPLLEEDTLYLPSKNYSYDIRVITAEGVKNTVVTAKTLTILEGFSNSIKNCGGFR
ncbi:MAG: hypothetical protein RR708_04725 [Bacilli bacterium]